MSSKNDRELQKKRDFSLIKQTLHGNNAAFATLMSFYKNALSNIGKSFFHNEADTEDFIQDVFIKVFTHLNTFKGKSMFSTWLMKIAWTTAINSVNRKKTYTLLDDETILADSNVLNPEEAEIRRITKIAIREALKELPEKYGICVEMYFYYDMPYQEISEITDIPLNTIKSHIFRAKKLLKEKLEDFYEH